VANARGRRTRRSAKLIDDDKALRILQEEAALATTAPVSGEWVSRAQALAKECESAPKTHIAMLGTALLAKATNPAVDVFAIKAGAGTPGAYSARNLAKDVLAANAPRLGIDLGVSGREPLNNQPYFRSKTVHDAAQVVRADGRQAIALVIDALKRLNTLSQSDARLALRAFLQVRQRRRIVHTLPHAEVPPREQSFVAAIAQLVAEESEGGKRAQAVVAGLLEVMYSTDAILVARVNDPDRHFPGDVAVIEPPEDGDEDEESERPVVRAFEVRDKPITANDLYHFAEKAAERGVSRAGVVAVSDNQEKFDPAEAVHHGQRRGVNLAVFWSWEQLVSEALFFSENDPTGMLADACDAILRRLEELEVSDDGVQRWMELVKGMERIA
jgi:hypothetical protein